MLEKLDQFWIPDVLKDIEACSKFHDQPKVAALISAARGAVNHVLDSDVKYGRNIGMIEEQWFDIVLDEVARYCHKHGLTETEEHLPAAFVAWKKGARNETDQC